MLFGSVLNAANAAPIPPTGTWLTADHKAVITIAPCGTGDLCGRIVGIIQQNPADPSPMDWQGQPQCGLTILRTAETTPPNGTTSWNGTIIDPRSGSTYTASITLNANHQLRMHGNLIGLPLLGQTQTWKPFPGPLPANCTLAPVVLDGF
jgi:uncharacterized protein (DUF2147 family)